MAWVISLLRRNERAIDCPKVAEVGDNRWRNVGIREDSAPVVDTEPISSWLKRAIQFTFPLQTEKSGDVAKLANASKAAKLLQGL